MAGQASDAVICAALGPVTPPPPPRRANQTFGHALAGRNGVVRGPAPPAELFPLGDRGACGGQMPQLVAREASRALHQGSGSHHGQTRPKTDGFRALREGGGGHLHHRGLGPIESTSHRTDRQTGHLHLKGRAQVLQEGRGIDHRVDVPNLEGHPVLEGGADHLPGRELPELLGHQGRTDLGTKL